MAADGDSPPITPEGVNTEPEIIDPDALPDTRAVCFRYCFACGSAQAQANVVAPEEQPDPVEMQIVVNAVADMDRAWS